MAAAVPILGSGARVVSWRICRLHDREIGGLVALENAAGIDASLAVAHTQVGAITHEAAG
jgi:hypothetical protein